MLKPCNKLQTLIENLPFATTTFSTTFQLQFFKYLNKLMGATK
jgi:hypothetical protein